MATTEQSKTPLSSSTLSQIRVFQRNELTEAIVYRRIAARTKDAENRATLLGIADQEDIHEQRWQHYTGEQLKPYRFRMFWYPFIARIFGFTFAVKLMEKDEVNAQAVYKSIAAEIPEAMDIRADEVEHENKLIKMLDEERLTYVGSMVLGLNDAIVEMSGSLAGFTLALQNTKLIALSGIITGVAATLSMASSEYLSAKSEGRKDAIKSGAYTGVTYAMVVVLLVLPFLLLPEDAFYVALAAMIGLALLILLVFNFFISIAQGLPFKKRFLQMAAVSLGVALLSFIIGAVARMFLGIDI